MWFSGKDSQKWTKKKGGKPNEPERETHMGRVGREGMWSVTSVLLSSALSKLFV